MQTLAAALVLTFSGTAHAQQESGSNNYLFFPAAPNEPRLQYLTKFSNALDVETKSRGFRDFVFGGEQFEDKLVEKPYGLAIFDGAVYVVDTRGGGYAVFDYTNNKARFVKGSGPGTMRKPINITIDKDGTRYITDSQRNVVLEFDRNDRFVRALGEPDQFQPIDVAVIGEQLFVTDMEHNEIHVLSKITGELLFRFGAGELLHPTNLAVGEDETLYVAETSNFRIQHYTPDGESIRIIGEIGSVPGKFARPKGVALDREGRIYVVDAAFGKVQVLDVDGTPLTYFGRTTNTGPGSMYLPTVVKIDYDNVEYFRQYAAPWFEIEYLVLVASQFGENKVTVFGFGAAKEGWDGQREDEG